MLLSSEETPRFVHPCVTLRFLFLVLYCRILEEVDCLEESYKT